MIDPKKITDFGRTDEELQMFWIFCIIVAGKNADWAARTVAKLVSKRGDMLPMEYLAQNELALHNTLVANKVGQYNRIKFAILESAKLDLRACSVEDLEAVHGVGAKTARFFLLHSRPDVQVAVIDTHIKKWLKRLGFDVPSGTPSRKQYLSLEQKFISSASVMFPGVPLSDVDLLVWLQESGRLDDDFPLPELPGGAE